MFIETFEFDTLICIPY